MAEEKRLIQEHKAEENEQNTNCQSYQFVSCFCDKKNFFNWNICFCLLSNPLQNNAHTDVLGQFCLKRPFSNVPVEFTQTLQKGGRRAPSAFPASSLKGSHPQPPFSRLDAHTLTSKNRKVVKPKPGKKV